MNEKARLPQIVILDQIIPEFFHVLEKEFQGEFVLVRANQDSHDELIRQISDADYIITISEKVTTEMIQQGDRLKMIHKWGVGYDKIDVETARLRGVLVALTTGVNSAAVAEYAIMMMLALYRQLSKSDSEVRAGKWPKWELRFHNYVLEGKTVGIVGFGNIGRQVAKRLKGFETATYYYDPVVATPQEEKELGVLGLLPLEELFSRSDIITLHSVLNDETRKIINAETLKSMKKSAIIINAARGPMVDEEALIRALKEGDIAGAALDVFNKEPIDSDNPLMGLPNVLLTPHVASATMDTLKSMAHRIYRNMKRVEEEKDVDEIYLVK